MRAKPASSWRRPAKSYSQAYRLVDLFNMLHRGQILNAAHEAERFHVSSRTIERDLAILREVLDESVEWVETPELGTGYRLIGKGPRWKTTIWQVLAVVVGAGMTGFLSGRSFHTQVDPLLSQLRDSLTPGQRMDVRRLERKIHIVGTGQKDYRHRPEEQRKLAVLLEGLLVEKPVDLVYHSHRQRKENRLARRMRVHPLGMTIHRGAVYFVVDVVAGDWDAPDRRILLALDRITEPHLDKQAEMFTYPREFDSRAYFRDAFGIWAHGDVFDVCVRVDAIFAPYVRERRWHDSQKLEDARDGGVRVNLRVRGLEEVAEWVLGMGEHAEALEPPELRKMVQTRLQAALRQYA